MGYCVSYDNCNCGLFVDSKVLHEIMDDKCKKLFLELAISGENSLNLIEISIFLVDKLDPIISIIIIRILFPSIWG